MSWVSLAYLTPCRLPATTRLPADLMDARAHRAHAGMSAAGSGAAKAASLGTASASPVWGWASPAANPAAATTGDTTAARRGPLPAVPSAPRSAVQLAIPAGVLSAMREEAGASGRDESEVWAEAAREWLRQRRRDDGPQPPTPAAAALAVPRRVRSWSTIDAALAELRQPRRVASPGEPAA